MDIQGSKTTVGMSDKRCFHNINDLPALANPATILVSGLTKATHFPDGFVKPGTIISRFKSGTNEGLWAAHVWNDAGGEGLADSDAVVWDGFYINADADGVNPVKVGGSILLAGLPVQMNVSLMPGLLATDGTTPRVVVAADLPASFIDVNLGV